MKNTSLPFGGILLIDKVEKSFLLCETQSGKLIYDTRVVRSRASGEEVRLLKIVEVTD